jgi:hypothetical protein
MIWVGCIATFFLVGFVFMLIELYRAPHGVQDERGFTVIKKGSEDQGASSSKEESAPQEKGKPDSGILPRGVYGL